MELKVRNTVIERVESFKYLGVYFDEQLTWDINVTNICKKKSLNVLV